MAEIAYGSIRETQAVVLERDVGLIDLGATSQGAHFVRSRFCALKAAFVVDGDICALVCQRHGNGTSDAAATSCDECYPVRYPAHAASSQIRQPYTSPQMPVYEFACNACGAPVSVFVRSISSPVNGECARCGWKDLRRLVSKFAFTAAASAATSMHSTSSAT